MAISQKMIQFAEKSSWIRKMFEEGAKMKSMYGAENVFDFSLGNPDAPPPEKFDKVLQNLVNNVTPGMHSYMANVGYQWVREAIAKTISEEQQVTIGGDNLVMTVGAAGGLNVVLKALLDPGDEVIALAPY
jgi:aspartate aminotransferase